MTKAEDSRELDGNNQDHQNLLATLADCHILLGDYETATRYYSQIRGREVSSYELHLERQLWQSELTETKRRWMERELDRVRSGIRPLKPHEEIMALNKIANEARAKGKISLAEGFYNEELSNVSP